MTSRRTSSARWRSRTSRRPPRDRVCTSPEVAGPAPAEPAAPAAPTAATAPAAPTAVTAGVAPGTPAAPHPTDSTPTCANCGALAPGKFCGNCGQKLHSPVQSVWRFLGEATEDLTHADSRLWRTLLALLLKPGFLTREFIEGRRVSYLPPIRLYLVLSVLFFLLAAASTRVPAEF